MLQSLRHRAISVMALIKTRLIIPLARCHVTLPGDGAHCYRRKHKTQLHMCLTFISCSYGVQGCVIALILLIIIYGDLVPQYEQL